MGCNLGKLCGKSKGRALSISDPNSFSNPEVARVVHMNIFWTVDFERKVIKGRISYDIDVTDKTVENIIFDTNGLVIDEIRTLEGNPLLFTLGDPFLSFGQPLSVNIAELIEASEKEKLQSRKIILNSKKLVQIEIEYETGPDCKALQFLDSEQTLGKKFPYLFSQCQSIYARSLLPCQDTPSVKATFNAEVTVPMDFQALMGAALTETIKYIKLDVKLHKFRQKIPIPSYLIAIAVGKVQCQKISQQSKVWAEEEILDAAAKEFEETEEMIEAAENLFGKYEWDIYDLLILPPSFPMGGMENPCMTFVTPTLIAGDKSLVSLICHEIAHSWFGNLVTMKNFEHFWLNEGLAVFAERKILGVMKGENYRQFMSVRGWIRLTQVIKTMGADNPLTKLVPNLTEVSPEDAYSIVPYEKGYVFAYYLETKVGGPEAFEPFLRSYIQAFKSKPVETNDFKSHFKSHFSKTGSSHLIKGIDWNKWLYAPGMPPVKPDYDTSMTEICTVLKGQWVQWRVTDPCPFLASDLADFISPQIEQFLDELFDEESPVELDKVKEMQRVYDFNSKKNSEVRFRWLRLCIRSKWPEQVPLVLEFVSEQGRLKFVRPLYRELFAWEEFRKEATDHFQATRPGMMNLCSRLIAKDMQAFLP